MIIGLAGPRGAGKTALAEALIPLLEARGLVVGYLKHAHDGFNVDHPGSDTDRALRAGARHVAATGPSSSFQLTAMPSRPGLLAGRMKAVDVVLAEGWHFAPWPKIVVTRAGLDPREVSPPTFAEITADDGGFAPADVERLADEVAALARRRVEPVELVVDGRPVSVTGFAAEVVARTVRGLLGSLRDTDGDEIRLTLRRSSA